MSIEIESLFQFYKVRLERETQFILQLLDNYFNSIK